MRSLGSSLLFWLFTTAVIFVGVAGGAALAQTVDFNRAWNPATPLPRFITHYFVDPVNLSAISRYRSGVGHVFSDSYEAPNRSLKNYFEPLANFLNTRGKLPVSAPTTGVLATIVPEGHILSSGERRGFQLSLIPDGYPQFEVRLFHVDLAAGIAAGQHVNAGDALGFADLREAVDFDWAVAAAWNATPLYGDPGQVLRAPGYRLLSPFDLMADDLFASYAATGVTDRATMVVPLDYRAAHPGTFRGQDLSNLDPIEFVIFPVRPAISRQPSSLHVVPSITASFFVTADSGSNSVAYQWKKNDVPIPGATLPQLLIPLVSDTDVGFYSVTVTSSTGSLDSDHVALTVANGGACRLVNVSTRGVVSPGGELTPGFVVRGADTKPLLIRAVGPTLGLYGVAPALADPTLEIIPQGNSTAFAANDNWIPSSALDAALAAAGAFSLPEGSRDAATVASVHVEGVTGYSVRITGRTVVDSGIVLAEVYDPQPLTSSVQLVNVSTLGYSGGGAEVLTLGFVLAGTGSRTLLIRVVGPGLAAYGVPGTMADPQLTVRPFGSPFSVATNNDWNDGGQTQILQTAAATAGAFSLTVGSKDAAVYVRLPPGGYTVQVSGTNGGTGVVLAEVYDVND